MGQASLLEFNDVQVANARWFTVAVLDQVVQDSLQLHLEDAVDNVRAVGGVLTRLQSYRYLCPQKPFLVCAELPDPVAEPQLYATVRTILSSAQYHCTFAFTVWQS
jgi:hypothetical protein